MRGVPSTWPCMIGASPLDGPCPRAAAPTMSEDVPIGFRQDIPRMTRRLARPPSVTSAAQNLGPAPHRHTQSISGVSRRGNIARAKTRGSQCSVIPSALTGPMGSPPPPAGRIGGWSSLCRRTGTDKSVQYSSDLNPFRSCTMRKCNDSLSIGQWDVTMAGVSSHQSGNRVVQPTNTQIVAYRHWLQANKKAVYNHGKEAACVSLRAG